MIDLRITNKEAIALHELINNRMLLQSSQAPQPVKDAIAKSQYENQSLDAVGEKLAAELDNLFQAQLLAASGESDYE